MNDAVTNFRRGTTEMLLLSMLRNGERFATDMANELAEKCVGTFDLQIVHVAQIMRRLRDAAVIRCRMGSIRMRCASPMAHEPPRAWPPDGIT